MRLVRSTRDWTTARPSGVRYTGVPRSSLPMSAPFTGPHSRTHPPLSALPLTGISPDFAQLEPHHNACSHPIPACSTGPVSSPPRAMPIPPRTTAAATQPAPWAVHVSYKPGQAELLLAFHVLLSTHTFTSLSPSTPTHHSDCTPACRFPVPPVHCGLLPWLRPAVLAEQFGYAPRSRHGVLGRRSSLVNDRTLLTATGLSDG